MKRLSDCPKERLAQARGEIKPAAADVEVLEVWKWTVNGMVADPEYLQYGKKAFVKLAVVTRLTAELDKRDANAQQLIASADRHHHNWVTVTAQRDAALELLRENHLPGTNWQARVDALLRQQ